MGDVATLIRGQRLPASGVALYLECHAAFRRAEPVDRTLGGTDWFEQLQRHTGRAPASSKRGPKPKQ